jgi:hypothetical protein
MARRNRRAFFEAENFAKYLGELIDSLPAEPDRQQVVSQLETLIQFLSTLKSRVEGIPTQQDALTARAAIDRLQALFIQAKSNPILAAAVGMKITSPRQSPPPITPEEVERANSAISRFESLPIDQLRAALEEMNVRDLQAVANAVGVRTNRRTAREALVHQVATKITTARGYRSLRDGTS